MHLSEQYSKHYYIESDRVVTKIGGGMANNIHNINDFVIGFDLQTLQTYKQKSKELAEMLLTDYDDLGIKFAKLKPRIKYWTNEATQHDEDETNQYYYHKDHLGSSTQISDNDANIIQHIEYLPYGESFFERKTDSWNTPYKFNAKELDEETGMYYYGARYYTPEVSIWLSVDPMAQERSWLSPYNYCQNNPVNLVDPTGALDGAPDNYTIFSDGTVSKEETNDATNTYTYVDINNGTTTDLGTYDVEQNSYGEDMVKAGDGADGSNDLYTWKGISSGNLYFEEDAFSGFLGGIQNFYDNSSSDVNLVQINQFMGLNRTHSRSGGRHSNIDVAFYYKNGTTGAFASDADVSLNTSLFNSFLSFGLGSNGVFTSTTASGNTPFISGTTGLHNHHHHFHFQGFNGNVMTQLPILNIIELNNNGWNFAR